MKILFHSYSFDLGWTYQENLLTDACIKAGHEVMCVASDFGARPDGKLVKMEHTNDPDYITRLQVAYDYCIPLSMRLRKLYGLMAVMEKFNPDVIFVHSIPTLNLKDFMKYKRVHPKVKIYYNTHTDYYTCGTNFLSMNLQHRLVYKWLINKYLSAAEKIFYISTTCGKFLWNEYKVPKENTEFLPLGGFMSKKEDLEADRKKVEEELKIEKDSIIFLQAGKMDAQKYILESLREFKQTKDNKFVFLIVGNLDLSIEHEANQLIDSDGRIHYLGWKKSDELIKYLNAADYYLQPGKVSAIFQTAMCCSCGIIARRFEDYEEFVEGNGWLINEVHELEAVYNYISNNKSTVPEMKIKSGVIASQKLDQMKLIEKFA